MRTSGSGYGSGVVQIEQDFNSYEEFINVIRQYFSALCNWSGSYLFYKRTKGQGLREIAFRNMRELKAAIGKATLVIVPNCNSQPSVSGSNPQCSHLQSLPLAPTGQPGYGPNILPPGLRQPSTLAPAPNAQAGYGPNMLPAGGQPSTSFHCTTNQNTGTPWPSWTSLPLASTSQPGYGPNMLPPGGQQPSTSFHSASHPYLVSHSIPNQIPPCPSWTNTLSAGSSAQPGHQPGPDFHSAVSGSHSHSGSGSTWPSHPVRSSTDGDTTQVEPIVIPDDAGTTSPGTHTQDEPTQLGDSIASQLGEFFRRQAEQQEAAHSLLMNILGEHRRLLDQYSRPRTTEQVLNHVIII